MSWRVEWLEEAAKDMRRLGKAEQKQVLKGIAKVSENPLPSSQVISGRIEWGPDIPVNGMSGPHHFPAPEAAGAHPARHAGCRG